MVTRVGRRVLLVLAMLPWLSLLGVLYLFLQPVPTRVIYSASHFTSRPALSREDVERFAVLEATSGSIVYRYVEVCNDKPFIGTMRRAWIGSAVVMHAPEFPAALATQIGCFSRAMTIEVPQVVATARYEYSHTMVVQTNWLRDDEVRHPLIGLTIIPRKE